MLQNTLHGSNDGNEILTADITYTSLFKNTNVISVMPMTRIETEEKSPKTNHLVKVARAFAWYINPIIYLAFCVAYFTLGALYGN